MPPKAEAERRTKSPVETQARGSMTGMVTCSDSWLPLALPTEPAELLVVTALAPGVEEGPAEMLEVEPDPVAIAEEDEEAREDEDEEEEVGLAFKGDSWRRGNWERAAGSE